MQGGLLLGPGLQRLGQAGLLLRGGGLLLGRGGLLLGPEGLLRGQKGCCTGQEGCCCQASRCPCQAGRSLCSKDCCCSEAGCCCKEGCCRRSPEVFSHKQSCSHRGQKGCCCKEGRCCRCKKGCCYKEGHSCRCKQGCCCQEELCNQVHSCSRWQWRRCCELVLPQGHFHQLLADPLWPLGRPSPWPLQQRPLAQAVRRWRWQAVAGRCQHTDDRCEVRLAHRQVQQPWWQWRRWLHFQLRRRLPHLGLQHSLRLAG